jgi:acetyltransferase-like isoleucine patch superfamily enzyme
VAILAPYRPARNHSARCYDASQRALRRSARGRGTGPRGARAGILPAVERADLELWAQKWRWYERSSLPWNRARLHWELARRRSFARWPIHGNVLEMLREGRLELGEHVLFEPNVWLTAPAPATIAIGEGTFLNVGVMVAAADRVEIGAHCMFANGCFVTDANHRFDDPDRPITWQGFTSKGPTRIGDNVWCGANAVVTSGVTIGERCVIGANSVVTTDLPPYSIAAGAPARVLRTIDYDAAATSGA